MYVLAEGPGVARGKKILKKKFRKKNFGFFLAYVTPRPQKISSQSVQPFVWPAIGNIYIYDCLVIYYIDRKPQTLIL